MHMSARGHAVGFLERGVENVRVWQGEVNLEKEAHGINVFLPRHEDQYISFGIPQMNLHHLLY